MAEQQDEQEEREGVPATDTSGASPMGVGESTSTPGQEMAGESEEAHRADRLEVGVGRSQNIDPESPTMQTGDQGG